MGRKFAWLYLALSALFCSACSCRAPNQPVLAPPSHEAIAADLETKAVALVVAEESFLGISTSPRAYCSGVWVSPNLILTAAHCVSDQKVGEAIQYMTPGDVGDFGMSMCMGFPGGDQTCDPIQVDVMHNAELVVIDKSKDLALARATLPPGHAVAVVSDAVLERGDPVFTMGNPIGLLFSFSSGEIAAFRFLPGDDEPVYYVQATVPISPGNSGGGLFDARGRLVGIARAYFPRGENVNLFVHRDLVSAFLKANS